MSTKVTNGRNSAQAETFPRPANRSVLTRRRFADETAGTWVPDSPAVAASPARGLGGSIRGWTVQPSPSVPAHPPPDISLAARAPAAGARDHLVPDVFLAVFMALRKGPPAEHFRAYPFPAIRKKQPDRAIRAARVSIGPHGTEDFPSADEDPADIVARTPDPAALNATRQAFWALPPRWRATVWLTVVEERKPADLAGLFGITTAAMTSMSYRARRALRENHDKLHADDLVRPVPPNDMI